MRVREARAVASAAGAAAGTFARIAGLPLTVDSCRLEPRERPVSSGFTRVTTLVRLHGGGAEGVGEDVTYDPRDHRAWLALPPRVPSGRFTFGDWSDRLADLDPFPVAPTFAASRDYRRWALESAGLDLALRQAGLSLGAVVGLETQPLDFVVSTRLAEPPSVDIVRDWLAVAPWLRFKLDPTASWGPDVIDTLAALEVVDTLDFKGCFGDNPLGQPPDADLYGRVARAFPNAWLEDPHLDDRTEPALRAHAQRITWDSPIRSVDDIRSRPWRPKMINIKPSRFGSVRRLFEAYDFCRSHGIGMYGGGQFELSAGRDQIQILAALFHPHAPNDVAPAEYNAPIPRANPAASPLTLTPSPSGFRLHRPRSDRRRATLAME